MGPLTLTMCATTMALGACGPIIALFGGAASLDSEPDKWLQKQLPKGDGEWDVVALEMRTTSGDANGELIDEVVLQGDSRITFSKSQSPPAEGVGWDEREAVWDTPDGSVDIHWDADSNGTEETLIFSITPHGDLFLWTERTDPYWSDVTVVDDDNIRLDLDDSWSSVWTSGHVELRRVQ